jgi:hypothetical protein
MGLAAISSCGMFKILKVTAKQMQTNLILSAVLVSNRHALLRYPWNVYRRRIRLSR